METISEIGFSFKGKLFKVLVIEDNLADAEMFKDLFLGINNGGKVIITNVARLERAIELIQQESFDLVLLDLSLPDSQGLNAIARVQQCDRKVPIVALIEAHNEEIAFQSIQAGAQDYLIKGKIDSQTLIRSLYYALDRKRSETQIRLSLEAIQAISKTKNFSEALKVTLRLLCVNIDWDFAEAWTSDEKGKVLEYCSRSYTNPNNVSFFDDNYDRLALSKEKLKLPISTEMVRRIRSSKQPEWIEGIYVGKESICQLCSRQNLIGCGGKEIAAGVQSIFGVPIVADEQVLAVLVFFKKGRIYEDSRLLQLINAVAAQLASHIQHKQAEAALLLSEERLTLALSASGLGFWDWNISTGEVYFDPRWKKMLGYEVWEIENNYQSWERLLHPEDIPRVMQILNDHLQGYTKIYEVEFRMRSKFGEWKWIHSQGKVFQRDESGKAMRFTGTHRDISDRKLAEEANQQLTRKFQEAERIAHIGNWEFDVLTGTITWSEELLRIYGIKPGKKPMFDELIQHIHPEDSEAFLAAVEKGITEGKSYQIDHRIIRPDGEIRYVNSKGRVICSTSGYVLRLLGTAIDITDRFLAEAALRESEQRFRAIFEQAAIGIVEVSPHGKFLRANPGFCQIIGYSEAELLSHKVAEITHPEDIIIDRLYSQQLLAGKIFSYSMEKRFIRRDGQAVWTSLSVSLVREASGNPKYAIGVIEDISDRKKAEAALKESQIKLQENNHQLEIALRNLQQTQAKLIQNEKMASLGQLVAGIAHEINNPINFIFGNLNYVSQYVSELFELVRIYDRHYPQPTVEILEQIRETDLDFIAQDLPKILSSMKVGAQRIESIVKSLRTFSRLDEAEMKIVDIHEGIDSTLMLLQSHLKPQGEFAGIQVMKNYSKLPLVECYAGQLNQVFMNILTNAIDAIKEKATQQIYRGITNDPGAIEIRTYLSGTGQVAISIADNGMGITEAVRQRLFDPFFTTKPVGKGTGLGLSIAHAIVVEKHGGQITCISTPGEGAKFVIEIPLKQYKFTALTQLPQLEIQNRLLVEECQ